MTQAALVARLKSDFKNLPAQLQEAARWVIDHPADVALLTTREQARRSGLAPATMTRLAQRFGLKGYEELRKLHADAMRRRPDNYRGRAQELVERREAEGDPALVQDIFTSLSQHMQVLSSPDAAERFGAAAEMIAGAERVYCLGQRSSFPVAYIFYYVRSLFGSASVLVDGVGATGVDSLRTITTADVLLAITVNPYVRGTVETTRYAKSRGARIVAITDSDLSPLAAFADQTVLVRTETPSFFHTMAPAFAAMECLAALVAARRGDETLAALAESEKQLAALNTYVSPRKRRSKA